MVVLRSRRIRDLEEQVDGLTEAMKEVGKLVRNRPKKTSFPVEPIAQEIGRRCRHSGDLGLEIYLTELSYELAWQWQIDRTSARRWLNRAMNGHTTTVHLATADKVATALHMHPTELWPEW